MAAPVKANVMCNEGILIFAITSLFGGDLKACAKAYTCETRQEVAIQDFTADRGTSAWGHCPFEYGTTKFKIQDGTAVIVETEVSRCFYRQKLLWAQKLEFNLGPEECIFVSITFEPQGT